MDPLLEVQRKSRSMDRDSYREALDRPVKAVTESTPYRLADLILNGEDAELPMAESLIPTVPLQAKLKQGKLPGLADILDVPSPLKAMGPIAFGLKEFRNGARMGKTLRNVEKAKDARKYVTAYHKTQNENVPSIDREGLKLQHPDYGANTTDTDAYSPMIWLSGHPTFIPVLRRFGDGLDETTTYRVKIPRKEFYETPRMMMPQGRGGPKVMAAKGEPSWSKEAHKYIVNTYGKDIPPEYLKKMDNTDRLASILKTHRQNVLRDEVADLVESGEIPSNIPIKYGVPPSEKFIRYGMLGRWSGNRPASNSELGNIIQDEMSTNFPPVTERLGYGLAEAASAASNQLKTLSTPKYPMSPFEALVEATAKPFRAKIPPFKSRLELAMNPSEVDPVLNFKPGAISRGINDIEQQLYSAKHRLFNWPSYNYSRELGKTPYEATAGAMPRLVYKNGDPRDVFSGDNLHLAKGAITRGAEAPEVGLSAFLTSKVPDKSDVAPAFRSFMHNPRTNRLGDVNSKLYEQAATVKGPYGRFLRNILPDNGVMLTSSVGSIGRGNNKFYPHLPPETSGKLRRVLMHNRAMTGASDNARLRSLKDYIMDSTADK